MSTRNIRTGFHRIGVAIALIIGVPSVGAMLMSLPIGLGWLEPHFYASDWPGFLIGGATFLGLAFLAYLAAWTLGWIIAGFAGDADENESA
jgi:hypothetical protein